MNKKLIAEAEVKFSITKKKYNTLPLLLEKKGFSFEKTIHIVDYFKDIKKTNLGWNFTRLRLINDKMYLLTVKKWSLDKKNHKVRIEDEHKITKAKFETLIHRGIKTILTKNRSDYDGIINGFKSTISLDLIEINNGSKYFIECEVLTSIERSHEVRKLLAKWLKKELNINTIHEAPSMLDLLQNSNS